MMSVSVCLLLLLLLLLLLPACLGWSSNFLEFRYPSMDERSRSRRARALFGFVAGSRGRDVTGIDYETWCSYCFQDEPLLLTYTCALQQARHRPSWASFVVCCARLSISSDPGMTLGR